MNTSTEIKRYDKVAAAVARKKFLAQQIFNGTAEDKAAKEKFVQDMAQQMNACTNCFFVASEAADQLLKRSEQIAGIFGSHLEGKWRTVAQKLGRRTRELRQIYDSFQDNYECLFKDGGRQYESLLISANLITRIVLLIGDRGRTPEALQEIENFIYNMPASGAVTDELLDEFRMR